jgi:hypothetical protein
VNFGLAPRPQLAPDDLAALVAAAEELMAVPERRTVETAAPAWRFSGRWFDLAPFSNRRPYRRH